ncbi:hypothetical protein D6850_01810 [Roseovarius spongiae]|uniref:Peptidase inhibitor I78 n=1 Tax=Roseovarius spongiae TaxID=2320272 RepID=A0A3A8AVK9_9RHOB|nr:I78 family peptidase inhibitor [Roseovarius spongiae]RKF16318.1 hypothetical protein D6850_01810 [Roseovarius spongiae]
MKYPMILTAALFSAACVPESAPRDANLTNPGPDACGASAYADTVGTPRADHDFTDGDRPLRIIPPDSAVTMDYRADRLNVDIDEDGIVTRVWCG